MLSKLAFRNAKRSIRDYAVYLLTMTVIVGLMFAFNTMLFSPDVQKMSTEAGIMAAMIGLATFFIVLVVAWLINYMVRFMLEKRSTEFGTYLLLGMKRKQLARLYMNENVLLGSVAFVLGLGVGIFLQQVLMSIFYRIFGIHYRLTVVLDKYCLLMTFLCFFGCFLLALIRSKRKFKKMNINYLMNMDRQNEEVKEKGAKFRQWLFFLSVGYFILFDVFVLKGSFSVVSVLLLILLLFVAVYMLYVGLSAFLVRYIRKGKSGIYQNTNLFLLRQMASKVRTMQFTMGTLSVLFSFALLGCTCAMMFGDYQNKQMNEDFPFDIMIHKEEGGYAFEDEIGLIEENVEIKEKLVYRLYQNDTDDMNTYLYTHLHVFGDTYKKADGSPDRDAILSGEWAYGRYDPYMKLSDYNHLRKMLGMQEVILEDNQYLIHCVKRVLTELESFPDVQECVEERKISVGVMEGKHSMEEKHSTELSFAGYYSEWFGQNGHNGADYVIVVPDWAAAHLQEYYSQLAVNLGDDTSAGLQEKLTEQRMKQENGDEYDGEIQTGYGTKQIIIYVDSILVKADLIPELKFILSMISFPLIYIGLVFLCVALTILSVQLLSDSTKYKFRYSVLRKLGMKEREIDGVIFKQLFWYYLCPVLVSVAVSAVTALFASDRFIFYTGITTPVFYYFGLSLAVFVGVYMLYFGLTYVSFKRNVDMELRS